MATLETREVINVDGESCRTKIEEYSPSEWDARLYVIPEMVPGVLRVAMLVDQYYNLCCYPQHLFYGKRQLFMECCFRSRVDPEDVREITAKFCEMRVGNPYWNQVYLGSTS